MSRFLARLALLAIVIAPLLIPTAPVRTTAAQAVVSSVLRHQVYERTFSYPSLGLANPWHDFVLEITLRRPTGGSVLVKGFYYDQGEWRWRFRPETAGLWQWEAALWFRTNRGAAPIISETGSLNVLASNEPGFIRKGIGEPPRLVFDSGQPYHAVGIGDCILDLDNSGTPHDNNWGLEEGPFSLQGSKGGSTSLEHYIEIYGSRGAGFNLFRWSVDNCSFQLWETIDPAGNRYLVREGKWGDELVKAFRADGVRIFLTMFGFTPPFRDGTTTAQYAAIREYVEYVIARYGAYVDFWEIANEAVLQNDWIAKVQAMIRAEDPYQHLISTSWERPELSEIEIAAPHWYESETETESDLRTVEWVGRFRTFRKPLIFGEQGNLFRNWDPLSARRMRIRAWTSFFLGGTIIFWNTSYSKEYRSRLGNIYLGPEERGYIRAFQNLTQPIAGDLRPFAVKLQPEDAPLARAYGLFNESTTLVYLIHIFDQNNPITETVELTIVRPSRVLWLDPATGIQKSSKLYPAGKHAMKSPQFTVDTFLMIVPEDVEIGSKMVSNVLIQGR